MELIYCNQTGSIRQMPGSHLIAYSTHGKWVCDPHPLSDLFLSSVVFEAIQLNRKNPALDDMDRANQIIEKVNQLTNLNTLNHEE